MTTDNIKKINAILDLKHLRREGAAMLEGQEKKQFVAIQEEFDKDRIDAEQSYRHEYKVRVDIAYRDLLTRSDANIPKPRPPMFSRGRASTHDLNRQAQTNVRFDHQQSMDRLDAQEMKQSKGFLEKSSRRETYIEEFKKPSERRRSETRRQSPERRRSLSQTISD